MTLWDGNRFVLSFLSGWFVHFGIAIKPWIYYTTRYQLPNNSYHANKLRSVSVPSIALLFAAFSSPLLLRHSRWFDRLLARRDTRINNLCSYSCAFTCIFSSPSMVFTIDSRPFLIPIFFYFFSPIVIKTDHLNRWLISPPKSGADSITSPFSVTMVKLRKWSSSRATCNDHHIEKSPNSLIYKRKVCVLSPKDNRESK